MSETITVSTGYGETRKTWKSAQREADKWNESGSGDAYTYRARPATKNWDGSLTEHPSYTETIVAEAVEHNGGFACQYTTTRTIHN